MTMTRPEISESGVPHLIFDIGGVLAEDLAERLFPRIAEEHGIPLETAEAERRRLWSEYAYRPVADAQQRADFEREHWRSFAEHTGLPFTEELHRRIEQATAESIVPVPGMRDLLDDLHHRGIPLAICSNQTAFWAHRLTESLRLEEVVPRERIVFSCDAETQASKRDESGRMFRHMLQLLREPRPGESWLIDDRWPNLQRAADFGIRGILVPPQCGFTSRYLRTLLRQLGLEL